MKQVWLVKTAIYGIAMSCQTAVFCIATFTGGYFWTLGSARATAVIPRFIKHFTPHDLATDDLATDDLTTDDLTTGDLATVAPLPEQKVF